MDDPPPPSAWQRRSRRVAYQNQWITVWHDDVVRPDGEPGIYGVVHFHGLAVGVVAIDERDRVALVGQHRYSLDSYSWEIPEGGVPSPEDPLTGAKRELQEETGLVAANWQEIGRLHLSNSVTDEAAIAYLATGLTAGPASPDGTEQLVLRWVPFEDALAMALDGRITDALSVMPLLRIGLTRSRDAARTTPATINPTPPQAAPREGQRAMTEGLLDRLARGPVLGDGGYLLELEKRGYVQAGPFTPEVSIVHPEALTQLHREFLRAGSEVLQALTFYATEEKLATVGLAGRVDDINRSAVKIARSVANEGDALVAGNLSLTWAYDPADPASPDRVRALFDRQLEVQVAEGIDLVIGETFSFLGEALIALERARLTGLPVVITMSFEHPDAAAYEGDSVGDCARKLVDAGADVVGVNCLRDPTRTLPLAAEMRAAVPRAWLATQPVAYRVTDERPDFTGAPEFPFALEHLTLSRAEMADYAVAARDLGVRFIGSCCGSVANHVRAMAKALGKLSSEERAWKSPTGKAMSAYEYYGHTEVEVKP